MFTRIIGRSSLKQLLAPSRTIQSPSQIIPKRLNQIDRSQVFAPPPPSSLPKPRPIREYRRTRRWLRRFAWLGGGVVVVYGVDRQFYASSITRSVRTFATGLWVALDYKINFRENPWFADSIEQVHLRNATILFDLLRANGGLYLKMGQAIAMQSAVLPPEFQKMFARMFDDAPQNSWEDVQKVIQEDFGKSVEEVFGVSFTGEEGKGMMERTARASASVAQVHWARLPDGREVAIKVQKREIASQVGWDLWAFKVVTRIYSWWFDLPFYTLVPYISERLRLETDFENEVRNAEKMAKLVQGDSRLRDRVYIPKVYHELSSQRIMTAEWIEGVRLWDKAAITKPWQGGWRTGSPGASGTPLDPPDKPQVVEKLQKPGQEQWLKPDRNYWKGKDDKGGLGLNLKEVMTTMVDLFSAQMFLWGLVHCDPHPGNIFIRRLPSGKSELVLIDHGLYIQMDPKFRHEYSLFWKSLLTFDNKTIRKVVEGWGIKSPDLFASATLLRPYTGGERTTEKELANLSKSDKNKRSYEAQQKMRAGVRDLLADEKKWPQELIFIGRNFRIVQGNNQFLGSPVNRIKITGTWASRALVESPDLRWSEKIRNYGRHLIFKFVLLSTDFVFYTSKIRQYFGFGGGMEDDIEASMKLMAKDMGVELNHNVFDG